MTRKQGEAETEQTQEEKEKESADGGEIAGSVGKERNKRIQSIKRTEEWLQTPGGWWGWGGAQADRSREEGMGGKTNVNEWPLSKFKRQVGD